MIDKERRELILSSARTAEWFTYRHFEDWKNDPCVGTRKLALKAKCYGIVTFDRVMRIPYDAQEAV